MNEASRNEMSKNKKIPFQSLWRALKWRSNSRVRIRSWCNHHRTTDSSQSRRTCSETPARWGCPGRRCWTSTWPSCLGLDWPCLRPDCFARPACGRRSGWSRGIRADLSVWLCRRSRCWLSAFCHRRRVQSGRPYSSCLCWCDACACQVSVFSLTVKQRIVQMNIVFKKSLSTGFTLLTVDCRLGDCPWTCPLPVSLRSSTMTSMWGCLWNLIREFESWNYW